MISSRVWGLGNYHGSSRESRHDKEERSKVFHGLEARKANAGNALAGGSNAREASVGQIKDAPAKVWPTIIDGHHNGLAIVTILYLHPCPKRKVWMCSGETISVEASAAGSGLAVIVVTNSIVTGVSARQSRRLDRSAAKQQKGENKT